MFAGAGDDGIAKGGNNIEEDVENVSVTVCFVSFRTINHNKDDCGPARRLANSVKQAVAVDGFPGMIDEDQFVIRRGVFI